MLKVLRLIVKHSGGSRKPGNYFPFKKFAKDLALDQIYYLVVNPKQHFFLYVCECWYNHNSFTDFREGGKVSGQKSWRGLIQTYVE